MLESKISPDRAEAIRNKSGLGFLLLLMGGLGMLVSGGSAIICCNSGSPERYEKQQAKPTSSYSGRTLERPIIIYTLSGLASGLVFCIGASLIGSADQEYYGIKPNDWSPLGR